LDSGRFSCGFELISAGPKQAGVRQTLRKYLVPQLEKHAIFSVPKRSPDAEDFVPPYSDSAALFLKQWKQEHAKRAKVQGATA
jgi:hypothetical protein